MTKINGSWIFLIALIAASQLDLPALSGAQERSALVPAEISEKELKAFAKVYVGYQRLRQTYDAQLAKSHDAKDREKIEREGNAKVSRILAQEGLTAERYNRLFGAVNNDKELRQKALKIIEEERRRS